MLRGDTSFSYCLMSRCLFRKKAGYVFFIILVASDETGVGPRLDVNLGCLSISRYHLSRKFTFNGRGLKESDGLMSRINGRPPYTPVALDVTTLRLCE